MHEILPDCLRKLQRCAMSDHLDRSWKNEFPQSDLSISKLGTYFHPRNKILARVKYQKNPPCCGVKLWFKDVITCKIYTAFLYVHEYLIAWHQCIPDVKLYLLTSDKGLTVTKYMKCRNRQTRNFVCHYTGERVWNWDISTHENFYFVREIGTCSHDLNDSHAKWHDSTFHKWIRKFQNFTSKPAGIRNLWFIFEN